MGDYRDKSGSERVDAPEKIDLTNVMLDVYHGVKRLWWLFIGLIIICAVQSYFSVSTSYQSKYVASATVSVTSVGGMDYVNAQSAQQMAEVFPYILTSGVLKDVVAEDMGLDSMPGSIDVKADDGTNLLTISVSGNDPQMAYKTLKSVIKNYPKVAEFVLGETKLTILDETGIPTDIKREEVIRGSYKRGALKGAIIGCVILLLYVLSRRTVKSRKDLKKNINLQDLGSIPYVRTKKRKKETFYNSVSLLNERISMSYLEAIRKLRIRIMKDVEKKEYQTLLVTSSIPGEGKTTLSANLAISIAQQGKKVLLVDCDLRNPSIAGVMNEQEPHPGLGSVLKKEVPLSEAITNVKLPKERTNENGSLHVIFGGAPDGENSLLIGSGRMRALIKALKSKYDIIILDTAPSELLADAPLLGKYVDAALYGLVSTFASVVVIDKVLYGLGAGTLAFVVTEKGDEVAAKIAELTKRGVTSVKATGTYTGKKKNVLLCACSKSEAFLVKCAAEEADENMFLMFMETSEVFGEGFRSSSD